jgi:methionyl-tRNA synthetase
VNVYFHEQQPWKLAKSDFKQFLEVLSATAHSMRIIGILLWPVMPKKSEQLLASLGMDFKPHNSALENLELGKWKQTFILKKSVPLFEKPISQEHDVAQSIESAKEQKPKQQELSVQPYISIDDFAKVELVVGTIEQCESIKESDKLLKLQVDFGPRGKRQILAGIRAFYQATDLIGKQAVFIFNLKPRMMLGYESQGMMLVAENEHKQPKIIAPSFPIPNGSRLK